MELTGSSHLDIQTFLLQIGVLLFAARAFGQLCTRYGQPAVIGEILAGVVLGPSFFGVLLPDLAVHFLPATDAQLHLLEGISLIGVLFLLFVTGLEIDVALIYRQLRPAISGSIGGLLLALGSGFTVGYNLPEHMLVTPESRILTSCFFAVAFGISALPVIARVLLELRLTRRNVAQTLFASAMIDDAIGWILLSGIIGVASTGVFSAGAVGGSLLSVIGLAVFSFTIGRLFVSRVLDYLFNKELLQSSLAFTISLLFLWGFLSQMLHLEAILGAFLLGIVFSLTPKLSGEALHAIESITMQLFSPLFFAIAGLKINLISLKEPSYLVLSLIAIAVAIASKFLGVYSGARLLGGAKHWPAVFFASGLNARGSMGIIVATIGYSLELLTPELYAVIVLMAVVTSFIAPPMLRLASARIEPDEEEKARLSREELESAGFFMGMKRVLIPLRIRKKEEFEKYALNELAIFEKLHTKTSAEATIVASIKAEQASEAEEFLESVAKVTAGTAKRKVLTGDDPPAFQILDEIKKGYDMVLLGVSKDRAQSTTRAVFSPLVDSVVRMSSCPVILVQGTLPEKSMHGTRILVPTGGSISARRATELSFLFLQDPQSELHLLKVVEEQQDLVSNTVMQRQILFGRQVLRDLVQFAAAHNVNATSEIRLGPDPETVILETIIRNEIDLLILGTRVRPVGERLYLGPRIEKILREAKCPVVVLNT